MPEEYQENYAEETAIIYEKGLKQKIVPTEEDAVLAGVVVETLYPPATAMDALHVLVALNLLNAYVKQPDGTDTVTYTYIKGMAASLFARLLESPIDGVSVYLDRTDHVAYFKALGVQISFHYVPLYRELTDHLPEACCHPQNWEGRQLQKVAVQLFRRFCPDGLPVNADLLTTVRHRMLHYNRPTLQIADKPTDSTSPCAIPKHRRRIAPPFCEDKEASLQMAFVFNIWQQSKFTLWRRKDNRLLNVNRYNGTNYHRLIDFLVGSLPRVYRRSQTTMECKKLYHVSPQKLIRCISPSYHMLTLTRNNYLLIGKRFYNLCFTSGIARYLAVLYPRLRFVCTLNYNRLSATRRYFGLTDLYRVPIQSRSRYLKVWMAYDPRFLLRNFDPTTLPQPLIDDYMEAEDYYKEFEIIRNHLGLKGIYAYRHYHLLPPVYPEIRIRNYHAYVLNDQGLWAIYALCEECFRTDFIFERIWYDSDNGAIVGAIDGVRHTIFQFRIAK